VLVCNFIIFYIIAFASIIIEEFLDVHGL